MTDDVRAGVVPPLTAVPDQGAEAACREVVLTVYRSIDAGRATDAVELFAEEAVLEAAGKRNAGRAAISAVMANRQARTERVTRHVLTDIRVSVEDTAAALTAALTVFLLSGPSPRTPAVTSTLDVRLALSGGKWLIRSLRSIRSTAVHLP